MYARELEELIHENTQAVAFLRCDQRLVLELTQVYMRAVCKRMSLRHGGKELFRPEIDPCAVLCRWDGRAETEIRFAGRDLLRERCRVLLMETNVDLRMNLTKIAQDAREQIAAERVDEGELEHRRFSRSM